MRILFLQDYLRGGGTERQTLALARHCRLRGHDASIITFRPRGPLEQIALDAGIPVQSLQRNDTGLNGYAPGLKRAVVELQPHISIAMGRMANARCLLLKRCLPHRSVLGTMRTGKLISARYLRALRRCDGIVVNCQWWRQELVSRGFEPQKVKVVYNGLVHRLPPADDDGEVSALSPAIVGAGSKIILINVGEFRSGKRHDLLIKHAARLPPSPPWELWLVGQGRRFHRANRLARRLGIAEKVRFWGYQPDPIKFLRAAHIAVTTSREDALPNFLIEAQAMGLPVVAYPYRGIEECFVSGESGILVEGNSSEAFRDSLLNLITDEERRKQMSRRASEFSRRQFDAERQGDRFLEAVEQCAPRIG